MASIIAVGVATWDLIWRVETIPSEAGKAFAREFADAGGGMAANAAVTVARLGGHAAFWGRVGDDVLGGRILDDLRGCGVDTANVKRSRGAASPASAILIDRQGERLIVAHYDPRLGDGAEWLPLENIGRADAVLADVRWPTGAEAALGTAKRLGKPAVLDADVAESAVFDRLIPVATHVIFAAPALATYAGTEDPEAALRKIAPRSDALFGVTLGSKGCKLLFGDGIVDLPAPKVKSVDSLGAGDAFHGAFALLIAEGRNVEDATMFANAVAALKCTRFGGRAGLPTRTEVEAMPR